MRWPRPPRPVRQWLRRWALEAVRAVDAWDAAPASPSPVPGHVPDAWLTRVRAAPGLQWVRAGEGRAVPDAPGPPAPLTFSTVSLAAPRGPEWTAAPPRRDDAAPTLTFSAPSHIVDARPVFPERPAPPPTVRTEVREVRPTAPPPPTWGPPPPGRPFAPVSWSATPRPAAPLMPVTAPRVADPPTLTWPPTTGPVPGRAVAWSRPATSTVDTPAPTVPAALAPREVAWSAVAEDPAPLARWPEMPSPPPDALDLWHAAQREQARWRDLEREQAGERWNGSMS